MLKIQDFLKNTIYVWLHNRMSGGKQGAQKRHATLSSQSPNLFGGLEQLGKSVLINEPQ